MLEDSLGWSLGKCSDLHLEFSTGCKAAIIGSRLAAQRKSKAATSEARPLCQRHPFLNVACRIQGSFVPRPTAPGTRCFA